MTLDEQVAFTTFRKPRMAALCLQLTLHDQVAFTRRSASQSMMAALLFLCLQIKLDRLYDVPHAKVQKRPKVLRSLQSDQEALALSQKACIYIHEFALFVVGKL